MCRERPHVLFLIPSLGDGGSERVVTTLLQHLDRQKFRLTLAVVDNRKPLFKDELPESVNFIDLRCRRVRYVFLKLVRLIWRIRPNVVFSTLSHLNLALAILRPLLPNGVRYIARESTVLSESIQYFSCPGLWRFFYRVFYRNLDVIICQSRGMRDDLCLNFGLPETRLKIINNPVDCARIKGLSEQQTETGIPEKGNINRGVCLVAAGRLSYEKGFDLLIRAIALCRDPRLNVTIMGIGPLREELEKLADSLGTASQVRFVGYQKNPYPFFAQADCFVLSSRYEGLPNVVLEALACGTSVVALPALGGVREILDGLEGCLVASDISGESLSGALTAWMNHRPTTGKINLPQRYEAASIIRKYSVILDRSGVTADPRDHLQ